MRVALLFVLGFAFLSYASAQDQKAATAVPQPSSRASSTALEAKVRKSWEDFKNKNKAGFTAILAKGFTEVEDDGEGPRDAKTEIAELDQFDIKKYDLKGFKVRPLGAGAALITYIAEYSGIAGGQPVQEKDAVAEVWVKEGGAWKALHVQTTKVK